MCKIPFKNILAIALPSMNFDYLLNWFWKHLVQTTFLCPMHPWYTWLCNSLQSCTMYILGCTCLANEKDFS